MFAYIVRRLIVGVIMLIVMSLVTFLLFFASPVDPARFACGKNCSPALQEQTRKALGLRPARARAVDRLPQGRRQGPRLPRRPGAAQDRARAGRRTARPRAWATPWSTNATVNAVIKDAFPVSLSLALVAFIMWIAGGVVFGVIAAVTKGHHHRPRHRRRSSLVFYAFPTFFIGLFLYKFVAIKWQMVADPGVHHASPTAASVAGSPACCCPASPWRCSTWPATSG